MAFYATCHSKGEFVDPAGRCGWPVTAHQSVTPGVVTGVRHGQGLKIGQECNQLVCSECGTCQGGLRRAP